MAVQIKHNRIALLANNELESRLPTEHNSKQLETKLAEEMQKQAHRQAHKQTHELKHLMEKDKIAHHKDSSNKDSSIKQSISQVLLKRRALENLGQLNRSISKEANAKNVDLNKSHVQENDVSNNNLVAELQEQDFSDDGFDSLLMPNNASHLVDKESDSSEKITDDEQNKLVVSHIANPWLSIGQMPQVPQTSLQNMFTFSALNRVEHVQHSSVNEDLKINDITKSHTDFYLSDKTSGLKFFEKNLFSLNKNFTENRELNKVNQLKKTSFINNSQWAREPILQTRLQKQVPVHEASIRPKNIQHSSIRENLQNNSQIKSHTAMQVSHEVLGIKHSEKNLASENLQNNSQVKSHAAIQVSHEASGIKHSRQNLFSLNKNSGEKNIANEISQIKNKKLIIKKTLLENKLNFEKLNAKELFNNAASESSSSIKDDMKKSVGKNENGLSSLVTNVANKLFADSPFLSSNRHEKTLGHNNNIVSKTNYVENAGKFNFSTNTTQPIVNDNLNITRLSYAMPYLGENSHVNLTIAHDRDLSLVKINPSSEKVHSLLEQNLNKFEAKVLLPGPWLNREENQNSRNKFQYFIDEDDESAK